MSEQIYTDTQNSTMAVAPTSIPPEIAKAIVKIQRKLQPLVRSSENDEYGSKYTPLHVVMTEAITLLNKHKIAVMQPPTVVDGQAGLMTILVHESGISYQNATKLALTKIDPQSHGSAITYLRRYSLMATLGLTSEEDDDDGNKASGVQLKPTEGQLEEIKSLCLAMKYPTEQIAAEVWKVKTRDHAFLTIRNLNKMVSARARDIEASDRALKIEQGVPADDGIHIPINTADEFADDMGYSKESTAIRLTEIGFKDNKTLNQFILKVTGKPLIGTCKAKDLQALNEAIDSLASGDKSLPADWLAETKASGEEDAGPDS